MPLMYVVLFRWDELRAYASNVSVAWPYNESKLDQFNEFARRYALANVSRLNEMGNDIGWMRAELFPSAHAPGTTSAVGGQRQMKGRPVAGGAGGWRSRLH